MSTPRIRDLMPREFSIPTLSHVVLEIQRLVADPDVGTREIGEVVAGDAPLLAKVLKMANSAFYGLSGRCASAEHACTVLGSRVVSNIVTQVGALQAFEHLDEVDDVREIWDHSAHVAELSAFLSRRVSYRRVLDPSDFYTYGLLHDLGKVVMVDALGAPYVALLQRARVSGENLAELEQAEFEMDHAQVGAYVVNRWALPEAVGGALSFHHGPLSEVANDPAVAIVYLANALVVAAPNSSTEELHALLQEPAVATLGLGEDEAQAVVEFAQGRGPAAADGEEAA